MGVETEGGNAKLKQSTLPPPPPSPPPRFWLSTKPAVKTTVKVSVTNQEIAKFWRQKRMDEEDHLLAAIKAAARIKARKLTEDEYNRFEESLEDDDDDYNSSKNDEKLRVGIKDWWTKSRYAYLNQPAIESMDTPKRRASTYIPNFCGYKPAAPPTTSAGIF
ncbi:uncharacterized protein LOC132267507 [Cornus florida]|uniref:uncharacterized protein LOC132267507 n=1 Tax=Cornus florida TaxID=4283 RepID=UPI00289CA059|nr:uncharacterized protein LOC132267507 [Cornus florida]